MKIEQTSPAGPEYIVLHRADMPNTTDADIILAFTGHEHVQSFVTWVRSKEDGSCFWGHYFSNVGDAYHDFRKRTEPGYYLAEI